MESQNTITVTEDYILPHQHQEWSHKRKLLTELKEAKDLLEVCNIINKIHEKNCWVVDSFSYCEGKEKEPTVLNLIKFAAERALEVEHLFPAGIKISQVIKKDEGQTYTALTKRQALCLSTNMLFSTVVKQTNQINLPIYHNFSRLSRRPNQIVYTYFNYLRRCSRNMSNFDSQYVVYFRIAENPPFDDWLKCEEKLCDVEFHKEGKIEEAQSAIEIDFANKSIGGFFLSETYTQEDIIFINNPELMPALLFHQYMAPHQCILMVGAERFSLYWGYLETYKFDSDFKDQRKLITIELQPGKTVSVRDSWISAIDAMPYFRDSEFNVKNLGRELTKAYVGFRIANLDGGKKPISTGNWGSGAFNGNFQYKFLIQLLAVSRAKRSMIYYSFDNQKAHRIPEVVAKLKQLTVSRLVKLLIELSDTFLSTRRVFDIVLKYKI